MTLAREVVVAGMLNEYQAFGDLVQGLSAQDWERPTRCQGWRVADVAAHVVGQLTDVVNLRLDGLGTPQVTQRQADERRGGTPAQLAEELEDSAKLGRDLAASFDDAAWEGPAPAGVSGTLGFGVEALWFDAYLHADDILGALGRPSVRGDGLRASVSHLGQLLSDQAWGPATLSFDGIDDVTVSGGGGRTIGGDPLAFVLVATGRADPGLLGLDEGVNVYRS